MQTKQDHEHPDGTKDKASRNRHGSHEPHHKVGQGLANVETKGANQKHSHGNNHKQAKRRNDNDLQVLVNDALQQRLNNEQQGRRKHRGEHRRCIAHEHHRETHKAAHLAIATEGSKVGLQKRSRYSSSQIRVGADFTRHRHGENDRQEVENGVRSRRKNSVRAGLRSEAARHGTN